MSNAKMEPVGPAAPKGAPGHPATRERGTPALRISGVARIRTTWARAIPRGPHPQHRSARPHRWMPPIAWALMTLATGWTALSSTLSLALAGDL
jgi:hypothetical protein